ncbi:MAG: hypothetical protein J0L93_02875 [Deltaproteobacteria bacterium]|nr:hypothetical protein [Deltaproteobacteria bacterium]
MNGSFSLFLKLEAECELSLEDLKNSTFVNRFPELHAHEQNYFSFFTQIMHLEKDVADWYSLLNSKNQKFCLKNFEQMRRKINIHDRLRAHLESTEEKTFLNISALRPQPLAAAIIGYSQYSLKHEGLPAYLGLLFSHDRMLVHLKEAFNDSNISNEVIELEKLWDEGRDKLFLQIDFDEDEAHTMIYTAKTYIRLWFHLLENIFLESEDPRFWGVSRHALPRRIDSLVEYYLSGL